MRRVNVGRRNNKNKRIQDLKMKNFKKIIAVVAAACTLFTTTVMAKDSDTFNIGKYPGAQSGNISKQIELTYYGKGYIARLNKIEGSYDRYVSIISVSYPSMPAKRITAANVWTTKMKPEYAGDTTIFLVSACSSNTCMANGLIRFDNL